MSGTFSIRADNIDGVFPIYQTVFIGLSHPNTVNSRSYLSFPKLMLVGQLSFLVAEHFLRRNGAKVMQRHQWMIFVENANSCIRIMVFEPP